MDVDTCEDLQCLNSNPCQTFLTQDNRTHARCNCGGRWAGPRCEHVIHLASEVVTSTRVQLRLDLMSYDADSGASAGTPDRSTAMSLVSPEAMEKIVLNYTLVFWRRNDSLSPPSRQEASNVLAPLADGHVSCVLLQRKHSKSPVLEGLLPRTRYTVCVENGFLDSCYLSSIAEMRSASLSSSSSLSSFSLFSSWPSNCVTIFTPGANTPRVPATPSTMVTAVATVSVFVLVILIIVFTVFLVRRQSEAFRSCVDTVFCDTLCCCCPETCVHSNEMPARSYMEELTSPPAGRARRFLGETPRRGRTPRRTLLGKLLGRKSAAEDSRAAAALLVLPTSSESGLPGIESSLGDIEILPAETDPALQDPMAADLFLLQATFVPPAARPKRGHRSGRRKRGHGRRKEQVARLTPVLEAPSETEMTSSEQASPDDAKT